MEKTTVYGLPLNPTGLLNELRGGSFCVSYATRQKLGKQLDQAIELVGEDGILLIDNGAFSHWKSGGAMTPEYIEGFEVWAQDILDRCPQAIAVIPDVICGTEEQNAELVRTNALWPMERCMPIWHMHESIEYLLYLCEDYNYVGFGSTVVYGEPGTEKWKARIAEAFAAIDKWEAESDGAYIRPRIHMMRAQNQHHLQAFDSSDSTNVAVNHNRQFEKSGMSCPREHLKVFAARIDGRIQRSAGPASEHQIKRPLHQVLPTPHELLREIMGEEEFADAMLKWIGGSHVKIDQDTRTAHALPAVAGDWIDCSRSRPAPGVHDGWRMAEERASCDASDT